MEKLENIKCYLLDMDGTIYLGNELIDGAKEFLEKLKEREIKYIFLTNNSSKNKDRYVEKLNKLGIKAHREDVFSLGYHKEDDVPAKLHTIRRSNEDLVKFL